MRSRHEQRNPRTLTSKLFCMFGNQFRDGASHLRCRATRFLALSAMLLVSASAVISTAYAESIVSLEAIALALPSGEEARPTRAWGEFCQRLPEECAVNASEPLTVSLTPAAWDTLVSVNAHVNAAIRPRTDP
jgi:predicted transglutaminase-like cysteine proteinase